MTTPTKTDSPKRAHQWLLDSEGEADRWVLSYEFHNGPYCQVCMESFCVNCTPGWADTECEGDDENGEDQQQIS